MATLVDDLMACIAHPEIAEKLRQLNYPSAKKPSGWAAADWVFLAVLEQTPINRYHIRRPRSNLCIRPG